MDINEHVLDIKIEPEDLKLEGEDLPPPPSQGGELPPPPPPLHLNEVEQEDCTSKCQKGTGPGRPLTADRKRPYPCSKCPSKFGSKMELEEHQNSHTGEKPFECDVCHSRFNRRSTLWNHKRIHSDTKPFTCPVCNMTFKWKNSLKCHKDMHQRKNELGGGELEANLRLTTYTRKLTPMEEAQRPPVKRSKKSVEPEPTQELFSVLNSGNILDNLGAYDGHFGLDTGLGLNPGHMFSTEQQLQQNNVSSRPSSGSACSNISSDTYSPPSDPTPTMTMTQSGYTRNFDAHVPHVTAQISLNPSPQLNNPQQFNSQQVSTAQYPAQHRSPTNASAPSQSMLSVHVIASPQQGTVPGTTPPSLQLPTVPFTNGNPTVPFTNSNPTVPFTNGNPTIPLTNDNRSVPLTNGNRSVPLTNGNPSVPFTNVHYNQQPQQMYTNAMGQQMLVGGDYLPNVDYVLNPPYAPIPRRPAPYVVQPQQRETVMVDGSFIVKVWPTSEW